MFTKTKLAQTLVAAGICCLSISALAGGPDMPAHDLYSGGWGLGMQWGQFAGNSAFGALASYTTDEFTASVAMNAVHEAAYNGVPSEWAWGTTGELGLRDRIGMDNLFVKYGAGAGVVYISNKNFVVDGVTTHLSTPWFVGPFVGLDYQPLRNLMVSGSIYPVTYGKGRFDNRANWGIFHQGSLALSYIF